MESYSEWYVPILSIIKCCNTGRLTAATVGHCYGIAWSACSGVSRGLRNSWDVRYIQGGLRSISWSLRGALSEFQWVFVSVKGVPEGLRVVSADLR